MNTKIFSTGVVISCFFLASCSFNNKRISPEPEVVKTPDFYNAALDLEKNHIAHLRLHGQTEQGKTSVYIQERKTLVDAFNSGNRSISLLRAYIYLASLEGDFEARAMGERALCEKDPIICEKSQANVLLSGKVTDHLGKPVVGSTVEVLGTSHKALTDKAGKYQIKLASQTPAVLRMQASFQDMMINVKKVELADETLLTSAQAFERDFTLIAPLSTASIDTVNQNITGPNVSKDSENFIITTQFTRYTIPFDAIVQGTVPYKGKLKASVFEFDRSSGGFLLDADAFDGIEGLATSLFITYGMPFVILTTEDGARLDILNTHPMKLATTKREKIEKEAELSELYHAAYLDSQKAPAETYPINNVWLHKHGNKGRFPSFWVFDRSSGYWDNVGMRFMNEDLNAPYNAESPFYTIYITKRLPRS